MVVILQTRRATFTHSLVPTFGQETSADAQQIPPDMER